MSSDSKHDDLFRAVRAGNGDALSALSTTDLNCVGESGRSLLHEAIAFKQPELALMLIEKGIHANIQDSKGQTALHYAATFVTIEIAKAILSHGGNVSIVDKFGNEPLWTAALLPKKDYDLINLLLSHGGDPAKMNKAGRSVLSFAQESGNKKLWLSCGGSDDAFKEI